jgi:hypothetical protein
MTRKRESRRTPARLVVEQRSDSDYEAREGRDDLCRVDLHIDLGNDLMGHLHGAIEPRRRSPYGCVFAFCVSG